MFDLQVPSDFDFIHLITIPCIVTSLVVHKYSYIYYTRKNLGEVKQLIQGQEVESQRVADGPGFHSSRHIWAFVGQLLKHDAHPCGCTGTGPSLKWCFNQFLKAVNLLPHPHPFKATPCGLPELLLPHQQQSEQCSALPDLYPMAVKIQQKVLNNLQGLPVYPPPHIPLQLLTQHFPLLLHMSYMLHSGPHSEKHLPLRAWNILHVSPFLPRPSLAIVYSFLVPAFMLLPWN